MHENVNSPNTEICTHFKSFGYALHKRSLSQHQVVLILLQLLLLQKADVMTFALAQLKDQYPRDDYKEFLEHAIIFLGEPLHGVRFKRPGAAHRARWMASAIYCLKMWLFRDLFTLHSRSQSGRRRRADDVMREMMLELNIFTVKFYREAWFQSPLAAAAPANDLRLDNNLVVCFLSLLVQHCQKSWDATSCI